MVSASLLAALLAADPIVRETVVTWDAPLECPGGDWLSGRIAAYLGRPPTEQERDDAYTRGLGGRVQPAAGGRFELLLELGDGPERIVDDDCRAATDVAASLLAIAIDPLGLGPPVVPVEQAEPAVIVPPPEPRPDGRASEPEEPEPEQPEPEQPEQPEPENWSLFPTESADFEQPARAPTSRVRGLGLADAGFALGVVPDLAPQVHAGLGVELGKPESRVNLRVELTGGAVLAGRFRAPDGRELGGDLLAWDVALRPCAIPRWGRVDVRGCISVGAGQLRGHGVGVQNPQAIAQAWVWTAADLGLGLALRRRNASPRVSAAVVVEVGGGVNALRPNFVVLDSGGTTELAYVMPLGLARARLGVELRFF